MNVLADLICEICAVLGKDPRTAVREARARLASRSGSTVNGSFDEMIVQTYGDEADGPADQERSLRKLLRKVQKAKRRR